jgi:hypothetical protein
MKGMPPLPTPGVVAGKKKAIIPSILYPLIRILIYTLALCTLLSFLLLVFSCCASKRKPERNFLGVEKKSGEEKVRVPRVCQSFSLKKENISQSPAGVAITCAVLCDGLFSFAECICLS